jgi:putative flippase GtrA
MLRECLEGVLTMISVLWRQIEALGVRVLGWVGFPPIVARQLIRFGVVGICAASTYIFTTALIVEVFGQSIVTSAIIAFFFGGLVSYAGNAVWSFEARPTLGNAARFSTVQSIGMLINIVIALIGERIDAGYLAVTLTVQIVVPAFNFICHRLVTFARRASSDAARQDSMLTEKRLPSQKP